MSTRHYDRSHDRLVISRTEATPDFWDSLWRKEGIKAYVRSIRFDPLVLPLTHKFLPPGARVIEGGCGRGQFVYLLRKHGYDAVGVDYAARTVEMLNKEFPELPIVLGDVRELPFKDEEFDGYWSLGVIEHFFGGYDDILTEMRRVVKTGGYVFVTFPHISPLRRLMIKLGRYPAASGKKPAGFYQFMLSDESVTRHFEKEGFRLRYKSSFDGFTGLRQDVPFVGRLLRPLTRSRLRLAAMVRYGIMVLLRPLSSHLGVLVFERR